MALGFQVLNQMVSGYFDFAEVQAIRHRPMYMSDYVEQLGKTAKTEAEKQDDSSDPS